MFEQDVIKRRPLHLNRTVLPRVLAIAENEADGFRTVSEMKLRAEFLGKPRLLQLRQYAHFIENRPVVWQKRFANMEPREDLLFEQQDLFSSAGEVRGGGRTARTTPNHQRVKKSIHSKH